MIRSPDPPGRFYEIEPGLTLVDLVRSGRPFRDALTILDRHSPGYSFKRAAGCVVKFFYAPKIPAKMDLSITSRNLALTAAPN